MEYKRFRPKFDRLYLWIVIPTMLLTLTLLVLTAVWQATGGWIVMTATTAFIGYFLISPCFGYVELREETVFFKFGLIMKREVPYARIRKLEKRRTAIAESMLSLKNAMEHVNVKFNSFDCYSVSVKENEELIEELKKRCNIH